MEFRIDHQCPQCGAPVELADTDRLLTCAYCRVSAYLQPSDYFRYLIPDQAPENEDLIYFPYWRFKGMLLSWGAGGVESKVIDLSRQGITSADFPLSAGLRTQVMKLKFVSPAARGRFIRPDKPLEEMAQSLESATQRKQKAQGRRAAFVGESTSLVFAPVYRKDCLMDGVINTPIGNEISEDLAALLDSAEPARWQIQFLATLCPHCGWDMAGQKDAAVMQCANCQSVWTPTPKGFIRLPFAVIASTQPADAYLPFWRIGCKIDTLPLKTVADLARLATGSLPPNPAKGQKPFRFWVPAFKINPRIFLRLARLTTLGQPDGHRKETLPDQRVFGANLPLTEAVDSLGATLASVIRLQSSAMRSFNPTAIQPQKALLTFVPFNEGHHEWIQPDLNLAIHKNALRLSTHI